MNLMERTKQIAKKRGFSIKEVAHKTGIGENSIYMWNKSNPKSKTLARVADVLGTTSDYLLGNTNDPKPIQTKKKEIDLHDLIDNNYDVTFLGTELSKNDRKRIYEMGFDIFLREETKENDKFIKQIEKELKENDPENNILTDDYIIGKSSERIIRDDE